MRKIKLTDTVAAWYVDAYPTDDTVNDIQVPATFFDVITNLPKVYGVLGVGDSIVRERVFTKLASITDVEAVLETERREVSRRIHSYFEKYRIDLNKLLKTNS